MRVHHQLELDNILHKIQDDYNSVNVKELKILVRSIQEGYLGEDIIISLLSDKERKNNFDLFARAMCELVDNKRRWGMESRHYVLTRLSKASYGLDSSSRKEIFKTNNLFIEDKIDYNHRLGFAKFKFFCREEISYLFLTHDYGSSSITNFIEEIVDKIQYKFLYNIGFHIVTDKVQIYYRDIFDGYSQVLLDEKLQKPEWTDVNKEWFDSTWIQLYIAKLNRGFLRQVILTMHINL